MGRLACISCVALVLLGLCSAQAVELGLSVSKEGPLAGYYVHTSRLSSFHPRYMGCYKPSSAESPRSLPYFATTISKSDISIASCVQHCLENNFAFAALSAGVSCFCGDELYSITQDGSNACRYHCESTTDSTDICGSRIEDSYMADAYRVCEAKTYSDPGESLCENQCPDCDNGCDKLGACIEGCGVGHTKQDHLTDGTYNCTDGCAPGMFGTGCTRQNEYCMDDVVHPLNGYCVKGCKDDTHSGIFCDTSAYGDDVQPGDNKGNPAGPCPLCEHCDDTHCFGSSTIDYYYTCPLNWTGDTCSGCQAGYWGIFCNEVCWSANCMECRQDDGVCLTCVDDTSPCDVCPANCQGGMCDNAGTCTDGCVIGFYLSRCDYTCTGCPPLRCDQTTGECVADCLYGDNCGEACPEHCSGALCDSINGSCTNCETGFYGVQCAELCSEHCTGAVCDSTTGECTSCETGFYGMQCADPCPENCDGAVCNQNTGACSSCDAGFYGLLCTVACPENCKSGTCDNAGTCTDGCLIGFYFPRCDYDCPGCPAACHQTTGECRADCLYGANCDTACPEHCKGAVCNENTAACASCETGFYGVRCAYPCSENCDVAECHPSIGACNNCSAGFHGMLCTEACPKNCDGTTCNRQNGTCSTGCKAGFFGGICNLKNIRENSPKTPNKNTSIYSAHMCENDKDRKMTGNGRRLLLQRPRLTRPMIQWVK